jgi:hypothetical protein
LKSLSGFSLETTSVTTSTKATPQFSINGYCSSKYSDIQVSVDEGKTWVLAAEVSTAKAVSCDNLGTFSYDLSFSSGIFEDSKWSSAGVYSGFLVRGFSSFGFSDSIAAIVTVVTPPALGTFTISGVTGGSDLTADSYLISTTLPTINWSAATGATLYEITIRDTSNTTVICAMESSSALLLSPAGCSLVDGTSYKVSVVAKDASGNSLAASNSPFDLTVDNTAPVTFAITGVTGAQDYIADAYLAITTSPTINWNVSTGADTYEVTIRNSGDTSDICPAQTTSATSLNLASCILVDGSSYKVKMIAKDIAGNSVTASNDLFTFTVDNTPPGAFTISGASGGFDVTPNGFLTSTYATISWAAASGAANYDVKILGVDGGTIVCPNVNTATTSYTFSSCILTEGASYYAKVYAKDSLGNSILASNAPFAFTKDSISPTVVKIDSTDTQRTFTGGDTINVRVKFSENITLAGGYLTLSLNSGGSATCSSTSTVYLLCTYTVSGADNNPRLDISSSSALTIFGGTLEDAAGNGANLTLVTPGTNGSWDLAQTFPIVGTAANLILSDGATYDFGNVTTGSQAPKTFTLTNSGGATATSISGASFGVGQFLFSGGSYPGGGTCTTSLAAGGSCTIGISFSPNSAMVYNDNLTVNYYSGISSTNTSRAVTGTGVPGVAVVTVNPTYPLNGAKWNDYIAYTNTGGGTGPNNQQDQVCAGTETGYHSELGGCIHGGEKRKVIVTGQASCTNLTITDNLGAFNWTCVDTSGTATFYSKGLAAGKGLRDLINTGTVGWKLMSVDVKLSAATVAQSTPTAWWQNHFSPLPDASAAVQTLTTDSEIYYASANINSFGYILNGNKMSFVTLGSSRVTNNRPSPSNWCDTTAGGTSLSIADVMLCGGVNSPKFLWIEADLWGNSASTAAGAISAVGWSFARIHNTTAQQTLTTASVLGAGFLYLCGSHSNLITGFKANNGPLGIHLNTCSIGSTKNTFRDINLINLGSTGKGGIFLATGANYNRFYDVKIANVFNTIGTANGIILTGGSYNSFQRVSINNVKGSTNQGYGVNLSVGSSVSNIFSQLLVYNTSNTAVSISASDSNIFSQFTAANNVWNGIYLLGTATNQNHFNSVAIVNSSSPIQSQTGSGSGNSFNNLAIFGSSASAIDLTSGFTTTFGGYILTDGLQTCSASASNLNAGGYCAGSGVANYTSGNLGISFNGAVSTADAVNTIVNGSGTVPYNSLTGYTNISIFNYWTEFEFLYRGWGSLAPGQGPCLTGNCQLYDWRANQTGPIYNISSQGNSANGSLNTDGTACVSNTVGASDITTAGLPSVTFFQNAMEIDGDGIGNDNGLCEAGEYCLWAPNVGAYQGEGAISAGYCIPDGGATRIYKYITN